MLGIERAVFAGHDWGGLVTWSMPLLHPMRTAGVIDLEVAMIRGCGHWTQQETPAELNRLMLDWLTRRFRP